MHNPKYCLFYDNHTMPACPDVGEDLLIFSLMDSYPSKFDDPKVGRAVSLAPKMMNDRWMRWDLIE